MTPHGALTELLARLGACNGASVVVSDEELSQWPAPAVAALKSQKLLVRARPAATTICPGCEQACVMPVHTVPRASGAAVSFTVCDKRSDINRVPVSTKRLEQWRCDADALAGFIAACLGLRLSDQASSAPGMLSVGMARGETRRQMLSLRVDGAEWFLLAGDSALPLAELLGYDDGQYSVDAAPGVAQLRVDWVASRPARARDASMTAWRSTSPRATVPHMDSIGVRQLQQNAAATVERVRLGESIEVTVRGRVVAKLVPVGGTLLDQLEASGRLKRGKGDVLDLGPPLKPRRGVELPSVALARMRANER